MMRHFTHRILPVVVCLATCLGLPSALGCAASPDTDASDVGATRGDAPTASDSGADDATTPPVQLAENRDDSGFAGCLDGIDGDNDMVLDCAEMTECGRSRSCCVGSYADACCASTIPLNVPIFECAGGSCGGVMARTFGAPIIDAAGLRATQANADDGVVFSLPLDARNGAVSLTATVPTVTPGSAGLDLITFGLSPSQSGAARVLPLVAVQINPALGRVALLVGETVVDSDSVSDVSGSYLLTLSADGVATASGSGFTLDTAGIPIVEAAYPIVYGRTERAGGVGIGTLVVERDECDVPLALDPTPITLTDEANSFVPGTEENPSVARGGDGTLRLAFDAVRADDPTRRGIFIAEETAPLTFAVRNPTATEPQPVIGASPLAEQFVDPELSFEGGRWVLFFAGDNNGTSTLYVAQTPDVALTFGAPEQLDIVTDEGVSLDSPTRFPGEPLRLAVRQTLAGVTSIIEFQLNADVFDSGFTGATARASGICGVDDDCSRMETRDSRELIIARDGTANFDADEVDAASLVRIGGVWRMYYAGRRGNRWTISVVISEDGSYWRRLSGASGASDIVLGADPALSPLGSRSPATLLEGNVLTMVFEGYRGTRSTFLMAEQVVRP